MRLCAEALSLTFDLEPLAGLCETAHATALRSIPASKIRKT
jgi:hypothetical protein